MSAVRDLINTLRFIRPPLWRRYPIRVGRKAEPRTLLVTGATGFIGRQLCRRLVEEGDRIIVLTRDARLAAHLYGPHAQIVTSLDALDRAQRIDAIINLAGAPILASRWTDQRRGELLESRLRVTNALVGLIARLERKPAVLISASAIGYYGVRGDEEITEATRGQPIFQSHLCQAWELAAQGAQQYGVRVCRLRLGLVFGANGGAFAGLMRPARFALRVILGSGRQWVSWIHIDDVLALIGFCIEHPDVQGGLNAVAPQAVTQKDLAQRIAQRFGRSLSLRVPAWLLRRALGEMSQLLIEGQRVVPMQARCHGFSFRYGELDRALDQLLPRRQAPAPLEIMYDTECPVCDMEMSRYCRDARRAGLEWRFDDVADRPDLMQRYRLDTQAARKRVYVLDDDGRMNSGIHAIALIWSALPGWRWLAQLVSLPVIRSLADAGYDLALAPLIWRWNQRRRTRAITLAERRLR
jgi:uncharacterized protein